MADQADNEIQELYSEWIDHPSPLVCTRLAERLRSVGRAEEALEVAKHGVEEWPNHLSILVVLGRINLDSGKLDEAAQALDEVRSRDPFNVFALKGLAEVSFKRSEWGGCIELLEEYLLENPGDEEMEDMLSKARLRRKGGDAEERLTMTAPEESPAGAPAAPAPAAGEAPGRKPDYPDTERMAKILADQGVSAAPAPPPARTAQAPGQPGQEAPGAPPVAAPSQGAHGRPPRSLLDLFDDRETEDLELEPYERPGEQA
ncbi:tetratricopeptide repeat protein [Candidatus Fermentibacterales bacterium]|nr:tetratricopeptide repeat protein [Candidatus Fermentibacterales bacterium]